MLSKGHAPLCLFPDHYVSFRKITIMKLSKDLKLQINGPILPEGAAGACGLSGLVPSIWPPLKPFSGPLFCDTAPLYPVGPDAEASQQPSGLLLQQPPGLSPSWLKSRQNLRIYHTRVMYPVCMGKREQEGKMC